MKNQLSSTLEELQWRDIRDQFLAVNPSLGKIIDEVISPGKHHTLFKARYPFGSEILKNGILQLPDNQNNLVSLYDAKIPSATREKLNYNYGSNPVSLVLKNSTELFIQLEHRIIPLYGLIPAGKIFGLWRVLNPSESYNPTFIWGMTAGARSIFMLPKISRADSHKKLQQKLNIKTAAPQTLLEHFQIFKEIEEQLSDKNPWYTEILFFSKAWFDSLHDKKWIKFHNWLLENVWAGSEFFRNDFIWRMVFGAIQEKRNIRPDPYLTNQIKHLFSMSIGAVPGFAPAIDDSAAPIKKIQSAYQDIYNISYFPTIIQPVSFTLDAAKSRPVYYSLLHPTLIDFAPKNRTLSSKISDLSQLAYLLNKFNSEILEGKLNLEHTPYYEAAKRVNYNFFHSDTSSYHDVRHSKYIPLEDSTFRVKEKNFAADHFPENCSFVRGCVRLSLANS